MVVKNGQLFFCGDLMGYDDGDDDDDDDDNDELY